MFRLLSPELASAAKLVRPNFTLIINESKRYQCHLLLAAAYCTEIFSLIRSDPDATEFTVDLPDPCDQFPLVISLLNGEEIEIDEGNMYFLCAAAESLGISILLNQTRHEMRTDDIISVEMEEKDPFNGIVMYLADIEKYEVVVTASSSTAHGFPENVLSRHSHISFWESEPRRNQWLLFDFDRFRVNCTSYIIQSADNGTDERHPKSWMILGTNDQTAWETIDAQENFPGLNRRSASAVFSVAEPSGNYYRYLKLMMTEANFRGDWTFRISQVEFFGSVSLSK
jgi:hypothetical protein